jgi:DNA mismatch repair ATPase MutS
MTQRWLKLKEQRAVLSQQAYRSLLETMEEQWYAVLATIAQTTARLDVLLNKVYVARENNYCAPELLPDRSNGGQIHCHALRHPLIEHLQTNEIYVPNHVVLNQEGMFLTGYNGIGKTSLIRAIGIVVIMAQSGFYVPRLSSVALRKVGLKLHYVPLHPSIGVWRFFSCSFQSPVCSRRSIPTN